MTNNYSSSLDYLSESYESHKIVLRERDELAIKVGELEAENDKFQFKFDDEADNFQAIIREKENKISELARECSNFKANYEIIENHANQVQKGKNIKNELFKQLFPRLF